MLNTNEDIKKFHINSCVDATYQRIPLKIKHRVCTSQWIVGTVEWLQRLNEQQRCDVMSCINEYKTYPYIFSIQIHAMIPLKLNNKLVAMQIIYYNDSINNLGDSWETYNVNY